MPRHQRVPARRVLAVLLRDQDDSAAHGQRPEQVEHRQVEVEGGQRERPVAAAHPEPSGEVVDGDGWHDGVHLLGVTSPGGAPSRSPSNTS